MRDEAHRWRRLTLHPSSFILVIVLLFSLEHLSIPLPLNDARVPSVYTTLAQQPGDFAVLELPTGWRNGARIVGRQDELIMMQQWYQTVHEKRRLGGNTSRNSQYKFQYFTDAPLIGDLIALMNADRDHIAAVVEPQLESLINHHRVDAGQILHDLGVRYVLLHTEAHRTPLALQRFAAEALPLTLIESWEGSDWTGQPAGIHLYAVDEPPNSPDTTRRIDLNTPQGNLYLAEGWSARYSGAEPLRLAHRTPIDLLLPSPPAASPASAYQIVLDARFTPTQDISLRWNGARLEGWTLDNGVLTFTPPPHNQDSTAMQRLTLHLEHGLLAHDTQFVHAQPGAIGTTGVSLNPGVSLLARSAGEEVGNFAQIIVNGHDVARNKRGYNLAALTPDGQVLDTVAFDTHADPAASDHLMAWLAQWREQSNSNIVIAGAVADEASRLLSAEAVAALAELGVRHDLRGHLRWSHAFVGVIGAEANTALEALDLIAPAAVGIGLPLEGPVTFGAAETLSLP